MRAACWLIFGCVTGGVAAGVGAEQDRAMAAAVTSDPTAAIRAELQKFEQNIGGRLERIERDTARLRGGR